jgi:2-polyprenyl-6-methoxyphenol hydroxylase-like FAD-dependent oxidoreductase
MISSHAMPPFLGQGANQAIQDAYSLASKIFEHNRRLEAGDGSVDLEALLEEYERVRWKSTTSISAKAFVLGYLESGSGLVSKLRDVVFRSLGSLGIAARVYLDAAVPRVE